MNEVYAVWYCLETERLMKLFTSEEKANSYIKQELASSDPSDMGEYFITTEKVH